MYLTCSELSSVRTLSSVLPRPESCFDFEVLAVSVDPPPSSRPCNTDRSTQRKIFRSVSNGTYFVMKRIHLQLKVAKHYSFK